MASVSELWVVVAIVVSYGLGTVPGALIVARRHGIDLRRVGDGNPGAWNALEQLGWGRAWPAFAIDGLKGVVAAFLGWVVPGWAPVGAAAGGVPFIGADGIDRTAGTSGGALLGGRQVAHDVFGWLPWDGATGAGLEAWLPWVCVAAAMLGHAFPVPRPGRGGKSVMTFAGGAIGLVPLVGVPLLALFVAGVLLRRSGLAARVAVCAFPFAQAAVTPLLQVAWTGGLMTLIGLLFLVRSGDRRADG